MKQLIEKLLTDKSARDEKGLPTLALSEDLFAPWDTPVVIIK
jgi:hypothetical protein